jgi:hypothetical protein
MSVRSRTRLTYRKPKTGKITYPKRPENGLTREQRFKMMLAEKNELPMTIEEKISRFLEERAKKEETPRKMQNETRRRK